MVPVAQCRVTYGQIGPKRSSGLRKLPNPLLKHCNYLEKPKPVDTCPHCQFLVREGSRCCEVCHKPLHEASGVPSFASGQRPGQEVMAARVGPQQAGFSNAIVWLFVVVLLLAAAVWATTTYWL